MCLSISTLLAALLCLQTVLVPVKYVKKNLHMCRHVQKPACPHV